MSLINQLVTKSLQAFNTDDRYFEGILTVEMKDNQGDIMDIDAVLKVLPVWMDYGAPITDTHSNKIVGKGLNYEKVTIKDENGNTYPAIKILGKIFNRGYELDDIIWNKIKNGEYKGLSIGGAIRSDKQPITLKDGTTAYKLADLELYEISVCEKPAVPFALITDYNRLAKSDNENIKVVCKDSTCEVVNSEIYLKKSCECNTNSMETNINENKEPKEDFVANGFSQITSTLQTIVESQLEMQQTLDRINSTLVKMAMDKPKDKKQEDKFLHLIAIFNFVAGVTKCISELISSFT